MRTSALIFRRISEFRNLEALAPAWKELLEQSASAEPMQAPSWLLTWWRVYGQSTGRTPQVGLFYDGEQLVGLTPLCQRRFWYMKSIPFTRLEFFGADMDEGDGVCSEYLNLIARSGYEKCVAQAFARQCAQGSFGPWHEIVLTVMNGAGVIPGHLLEAFQSAGYHCDLRTITEVPYLLRPDSWEAYLQSLNASKRRYLVLAWRNFEDWAGPDWRVEKAEGAASLAKGRQILESLHNHRWQDGAGIEGAFNRPRFSAFHQEYMGRLLEEGSLDLFWLEVRGEPIAISYQIKANQKVYLYQSGRKLDLPPAIRPGIVLTILAIQQLIAQGLREYDFLGWPTQYKSQFTKTTRPLVTLRITRSCPREWLRRGADAALVLARSARRSLATWRAKE